jgi:flagellar protein FliL
MADEKEEASGKSGGGNGLVMVVLILLVLLLGGLGVGGYMLYEKGFFDKDKAPAASGGATSAATNSNGNTVEADGTDRNLSSANLHSAEFKNIVLNIQKNNGRNALMKLAFTLKSKEEGIAARAEANTAEIMDIVISLISTKTAEELRTLGGKEVLKEELVMAINDVLNANITPDTEGAVPNGVKKIYFVNFVIK